MKKTAKTTMHVVTSTLCTTEINCLQFYMAKEVDLENEGKLNQSINKR
jgi:hypothetical protein